VQRIVRVNTFDLGVWARGGRTLREELLESGFQFYYSSNELVLHVVHFSMNGNNIIIQFFIGFILASGDHLDMNGGSTNKKEDKLYMPLQSGK
jgi:hypothetical protein